MTNKGQFVKGHKVSPEIKEKISRTQKGNKKKPHSDETKKKIGEANKTAQKGKKLSQKTKDKIRVVAKIKYENGGKEQMQKGLKEYWDKRGRKLYKRYIHFTNTTRYKKWRMEVFLRDNFTCQNCWKRGCYLEAHHIKSWAEYPKLRYIVDNGVTLCKDCHKLI